MRLNQFKYLVVFICLFSLLESTGISMIRMIVKASITHVQKSALADDDATERSDREVNLKEILAVEAFCTLPSVALHVQTYNYSTEAFVPHLGWISPVPTPPPDFVI